MQQAHRLCRLDIDRILFADAMTLIAGDKAEKLYLLVEIL
jgi:hypothetical protein